MFNKNEYLKSNDKKILHKIKKVWVIISVALFIVIGGFSIENAHADNHDTTENSLYNNDNIIHRANILHDKIIRNNNNINLSKAVTSNPNKLKGC